MQAHLRQGETETGLGQVVPRCEAGPLRTGGLWRLVEEPPPMQHHPFRHLRERDEDVVAELLQIAVVHLGRHRVADSDGELRHGPVRYRIRMGRSVVHPLVVKNRHCVSGNPPPARGSGGSHGTHRSRAIPAAPRRGTVRSAARHGAETRLRACRRVRRGSPRGAGAPLLPAGVDHRRIVFRRSLRPGRITGATSPEQRLPSRPIPPRNVQSSVAVDTGRACMAGETRERDGAP